MLSHLTHETGQEDVNILYVYVCVCVCVCVQVVDVSMKLIN